MKQVHGEGEASAAVLVAEGGKVAIAMRREAVGGIPPHANPSGGASRES